MNDIKILLGGLPGSGKSYLLKRLINVIRESNGGKLKTAGFCTKLYVDQGDECRMRTESHGKSAGDRFRLYMFPADKEAEDQNLNEEYLLGEFTEGDKRVNADRFRTYGVSLLSDIPEDALVIMDEIGTFEQNVTEFTDKVFEVLSGPNPVLAVVKEREGSDFLAKVRTFPGTLFYNVTEENRDELAELLQVIVCR